MTIGSRIQPKKQSKVQIIGILEKIDKKCSQEKVPKNLGMEGPPLIWTKSKRTAAFFREPFPYRLTAVPDKYSHST